MAPRKLSDADKRQITSIYCQPGETTSTLANKFGISSSTVSRVLKQVLPDEEYAKLMKWKRSGERGSFPLASSPVVEQLEAETNAPDDTDQVEQTDTEVPVEAPEAQDDEATKPEPIAEPDESSDSEKEKPTPRRSRRRRSTAKSVETTNSQPEPSEDIATDNSPADDSEKTTPKPVPAPRRKSQPAAVAEEEEQEVAAWVSEGLADPEEYDEESDEDWDDETWDDDDESDEGDSYSVPREAALTIHSFDSFSFTKPCYLVVDRMAELITCPLKDFSELGAIPPGEEQARTLPVFDNHRVARRFARRNQRIIKVPDGLMLNKTQGYLEAKGITRILFEGEVYALSPN